MKIPSNLFPNQLQIALPLLSFPLPIPISLPTQRDLMIFVNFHRHTSRHFDMQTHMTRHKSTRKTLRSTKKVFPSFSEKIPLSRRSRAESRSPRWGRHALTASIVIIIHLCVYCLSILFLDFPDFSEASSQTLNGEKL